MLPFAGIVVLKLQFGSFRGRAEISETTEEPVANDTRGTETRARETDVVIFHNSESACVQKTAEFINAPRALLSTPEDRGATTVSCSLQT